MGALLVKRCADWTVGRRIGTSFGLVVGADVRLEVCVVNEVVLVRRSYELGSHAFASFVVKVLTDPTYFGLLLA